MALPFKPNDPNQKMTKDESANEVWRQSLLGGEPMLGRAHHLFGLLPSNPRCKMCNAPFQGFGAPIMRLIGKRQSNKNPHFCSACESFASTYQGGTEIELTMLFVDVRGSTSLAEGMNPTEFSNLMNRFYEEAINVLVHYDAFIDKLVGDEVTALFFPGFAGQDHARSAIEAGKKLLDVMGYGQPGGAWIPIGVGIHTGVAWVGAISGANGDFKDFTALGDNVNITARLASKASAGEVLVSEDTCNAARFDFKDLEKRELELKGKSELVSVRVLRAK
jgi:adenylate cyclase